jgi:hypothetical protein
MRKLVSLTGVFSLCMVALLIPALGLAQPTLIELGNTGQIVNSGTAVVVSVDVACTNDTTSAILNSGVAQRGAGAVVARR